MTVSVFELEPEDLRALVLSPGYPELRSGSIQLAFTKLHELELFVINLFAPKGHVFRDFALYPAISKYSNSVADELYRNHARARLDAFLNNNALEIDGGVPRCLLSPLTSIFADAYAPPWFDYEFDALCASRHFSICGKLHELSEYLEYFKNLGEAFSDSGVAALPENCKVVVEHEWEKQDPYNLYLGRYIGALSAAEMEECAAWAARLEGSEMHSVLDDLSPLYWLAPAISLVLPLKAPNEETAMLQDEILLARTEVAIACASKKVLLDYLRMGLAFERHYREMRPARYDAIGKILTVLAASPIVFEAPSLCR